MVSPAHLGVVWGKGAVSFIKGMGQTWGVTQWDFTFKSTFLKFSLSDVHCVC